jgi:hypothetical protein
VNYEDAVQPTGIYQHVSSDDTRKLNQRPEPVYDPRSGDHCWIALAAFYIADPDATDNSLDKENLFSINLGCYFCEEQYQPLLRHRRCKGEPRS